MGRKAKKHSNPTSSTVNESTGIINYLKEAPLSDQLLLTNNGILSFHWANWKNSRDFLKSTIDKLATDPKIELVNTELEQLKYKPIWLKNKRRSIKSNLYELYENYLDPRIRMTWFDREDEILLSTHNESGPYMALTSMRWIDKTIYTAFVHRKMLLEFVPRRSFRVGLNMEVTALFNNSPLTQVNVIIHQATSKGLILKFENGRDISRALNSKVMNISLNLLPIVKSKNADFPGIIKAFGQMKKKDFQKGSTELVILSDVFHKFGNKDSIKSADGNNFFIFVPFSEIMGLDKETNIEECFQNILTKIEMQFTKELEEVTPPELALEAA